MTSSRPALTISLRRALSLLLFTAAPHMAAAQETCGDDSDCDAGFVCQSFGGGACPEISCLEGDEDCLATVCETEEIKSCVPLTDCESDDQCPEGYLCSEQTRVACSGAVEVAPCSVDDSEEACAARRDQAFAEACEETTVKECTPRWAAECEEDTDCGEGFTCELATEYSCGGSAGGGVDGVATGGAQGDSPDGGTADPESTQDEAIQAAAPEQGDCEATTLDYGFCQLKELPCESDNDCNGDLLCKEVQSFGACTAAAPAPSDGDSNGGSAGAIDLGCEEPESSMQCMPRYYDYGGWVGIAASAEGEVALDTGTNVDDSNGAAGGSGGMSGADEDSAASSTADGVAGESSGDAASVGCRVGGPAQAMGQLAWLGLPLILMRRRRSRS